MIGEIAARLSGGYMSGWTFPYSSGFELTKEAMKIALGIPSDFSDINEIPSAKFSHERAFISIPGKIKKIYGEEKAWASPFLKNIFFRVKEGSAVDFPRNNVEKCGNVISSSKERGLSKKSAESAVAQIVLRLEPKNPQTEKFLYGFELPQEKGFPFSAFDFNTKDEKFLDELEQIPFIEKNQPAQNCIPESIKKIMEKRDWNFRSVRNTLFLFDKISPEHPRLDSKKFWCCLLRAGIQGILY